jgi:hypothetical protein
MEPRTRLKQVLVDQGRHQRWLAGQIGKHESEVSRIVNGLIPAEDVKVAIALALGQTVDALWPPKQAEQAAA